MLLLGGEQRLGGREVGQAEPGELLLGVGLGLAELCLHLGPPTQAPVDLDVAHLLVDAVAAAEPPRHEGEDEADSGGDAADERRRATQIDDAGDPCGHGRGRDEQPDDDEPDRDA